MKEEFKYLEHFGLEYNPFPVAPDYEKFFLSDHIDLMISEIVHGILTRKGFLVLTGGIGLGKTTISRKILGILEEKNVETSLIVNTLYQDVELLREINRDFGLVSSSLTLSDQMEVLNQFLVEANKKGKNCAIIIDDAQNLSVNNLELIRMISNLETDSEKLVQILLVGQSELMEKLDAPELTQLKSRFVIKKEAIPLTKSEAKNYVMFKMNMAGNQGKTTVTAGAFQKIYGYSGGNFRRINMLMDRCLYVAFVLESNDIDKFVVAAAISDLVPEKKSRTKSSRYWFSAVTVLFVACLAGAFFLDLIPGLDHSFTKPVVSETTGPDDSRTGTPSAPAEPVKTIPSSDPLIPDTATHAAASPLPGKKPAKETPLPSTTSANNTPATVQELLSPPPAVKEAVPEAPPIPLALTKFLEYYNLTRYEEDFYRSMVVERFKDITDRIYEETGYQLIQLDQLSYNIKVHYAVFSFVSRDTEKKLYSLFWKPALRIKNFYPDYTGEEIRQLEELLSDVHLYTYHLDGKVGPRLMKALSRFQIDQGIKVTGFPDNVTVFLLCQGGV